MSNSIKMAGESKVGEWSLTSDAEMPSAGKKWVSVMSWYLAMTICMRPSQLQRVQHSEIVTSKKCSAQSVIHHAAATLTRIGEHIRQYDGIQ
jgi:hypothetical protein